MNKLFTATMAFTVLALAACKKDKPLPPDPTPPVDQQATISMSFGFVSGMNTFNMENAYADGAGNAIRFNKLKFYVSHVHLTDDDGGEVATFHDKYLLVDASTTSNVYTLGTMDPGHIHDVHFTLGMDSATNHADPMLAEFPLDQPDMHWFWNPSAGYIFLKAEGYVDVNSNGTFEQGVDQPFEYHCATLALRREKHLHIHADVHGGETLTLAAKVDVNLLLTGLDLLTNHTAHGGGPNAAAMMDNLVTAILAH